MIAAASDLGGGRQASEAGRSEACRRLLIDTHVHLHACFDPARLLDAGAENLRKAAGGSNATGVLVFTETADAGRFGEWWARAPFRLDGWEIARTAERSSLTASSGDARLTIIAGRQVRCRDRLEVLAVGTEREFAEGLELGATVREVLAVGAAAAIPWGWGKWWFERGKAVETVLDQPPEGAVFLGDNGGRPRSFPRPRLFVRATECGLPVLAGSDPLPLTSEVRRVGSYGSVLRTRWDPERPTATLLEALERLRATPPTFGRRVGAGRFLALQLGLRLSAAGKPREDA